MWELAVALGIGIGIPAIGALYAFARYLHKKSICFTLMQNKLNTLAEHDEGSNDLHDGFDKRLDKIEFRQAKNEIYLQLLLDDRKIPYNP